MDLYYIVGNYEITNTQARVITVLAEQKNNGSINGEYHDKIMNSLKKIASVLKKVLSKEILLSMLKIIKKNPNLTLPTGKFNQNKISLFTIRLQKHHAANIERLQSEIQDKKIESDIEKVFNLPGGKERYWDQVSLEYCLKNYQVEVRACTFEDIIEIDTYNDLKNIDHTYI